MIKKDDIEIKNGTVSIAGGQVGFNMKSLPPIQVWVPDAWLAQFNENYYGRSKEAQELEGFLKHNFKGNPYIPWAVMERMVYQQDPTATFTKGSEIYGTETLVLSTRMEVETNIKGELTIIQAHAHFVKVSLTFLGKTFIEHYPVQDNAYGAPKVYDQNQINKALQRALAKVASRATGLGLTIYEKGELQFEELTDSGPKKPVARKTEEALESMKGAVVATEAPKVVEAKPVEATTEETDVIKKIVLAIKSTENEDKIKNILRTFNPSFLKQYGFTISQDETVEEMIPKLLMLSDPNKFLLSLERMSK